MKTAIRISHALAIVGLIAAGACGGGSNTPTGPSDGGGGGGAQSGATITIGANGVSPAQVTINAGQTVTFVNNSSRTRNMHSDPHPAHTDCTQVSAVSLIGPGQTKATGTFTAARTCGFHDHDDPDNATVKGTIVIR